MTVTRDVFAARAAPSRRLNAFKRRTDVAFKQVDVRRQREGRGVVAEPSLYLNRVAALGEQERGARVAEGVEANPLQACLLTRRQQHASTQVAHVKELPVAGGAHEVLVGGPLGLATTRV